MFRRKKDTTILRVGGSNFRPLQKESAHRHFQCVRLSVRKAFAAKSSGRSIFAIVRIEHHIFGCKVIGIGRQQFRKYQMAFIPIHVLVRISVDKRSVDAGVRMNINYKIDLIALKRSQPNALVTRCIPSHTQQRHATIYYLHPNCRYLSAGS